MIIIHQFNLSRSTLYSVTSQLFVVLNHFNKKSLDSSSIHYYRKVIRENRHYHYCYHLCARNASLSLLLSSSGLSKSNQHNHYDMNNNSTLQSSRSIYTSSNNKYHDPSTTPANTSTNTSYKYDFRSDTVTLPTQEMKEIMVQAVLGDDVYDEDATVHALQTHVAELTGHEAALFGATGTMMNQVAIRTHLKQPPYSVLCDKRAHVFRYEASGTAFHSRAHTITIVPSNNHHLTLNDIKENIIQGDDIHDAPTHLICLENTLNGTIMPLEEIKKISNFARENGILMHLDGARLWNASLATSVSLKEYGKWFDSMSLCLSKGLGAPIGSVLVGKSYFIRKAKHFRKLFGGGWRQAGLLASAGLYAIQNHWQRMSQDHEHANMIYSALQILNLHSTYTPTETNMVWIDTSRYVIIQQEKGEGDGGNVYRDLVMDDLAQVLAKHRMLVFGGMSKKGRLVFHLGIPREGVLELINVLENFIQNKENGVILKDD